MKNRTILVYSALVLLFSIPVVGAYLFQRGFQPEEILNAAPDFVFSRTGVSVPPGATVQGYYFSGGMQDPFSCVSLIMSSDQAALIMADTAFIGLERIPSDTNLLFLSDKAPSWLRENPDLVGGFYTQRPKVSGIIHQVLYSDTTIDPVHVLYCKF